MLSKERCTGDVAKRTGNEYQFQELAAANVEDLQDAGVKKVVTSCPHCLKTLGHDYRQFGFEGKVVHSSVLVEEITRHEQPLRLEEEAVTFHDPCYLGRYAGEHEAPRALLERYGGDVAEPERTKDNPFCCGAGGGLAVRGARGRHAHQPGAVRAVAGDRREHHRDGLPVLLDHAQGRARRARLTPMRSRWST